MYAKVFASLWQGTLYGKTDAQLVFIFLLANCDSDGFIRIVPEAIASPTGLTVERVSAALELLESADPASGSPAEEGRRLVRISDSYAWSITNYAKYRGMRDEDERRRQTREAVARFRDKSADVSRGKPPKADVSHGKPQKAQAEAEAEAEAEEEAPGSSASPGASGNPVARRRVVARKKPRAAAAAGFRDGLIGELQTRYPDRDVSLIAEKVLEHHLDRPFRSLNAALRGWVAAAETRDMDRKSTNGEGPSQVDGRRAIDGAGQPVVWYSGAWRSLESASAMGWDGR